MKKILIMLICIFCTVGFSQTVKKEKKKPFVPGFLGKRFSLAVTGSGAPTFGQTMRYDANNPSYVGATWKVGLDGGYAITENSTIGFFFNFTNTACYYYSPTISLDSNYYSQANLNIFQAGVSYKWFMGNNVAPVGPYMQVKAGIAIFNGSVMNRNNQSYFTNNYVDLAFYYSIGRQHVIKKILLLDYGIELGAVGFINFIDNKNGERVWVKDDIGNDYNFQYGDKAAVINTIQLYAGLGVIF